MIEDIAKGQKQLEQEHATKMAELKSVLEKAQKAHEAGMEAFAKAMSQKIAKEAERAEYEKTFKVAEREYKQALLASQKAELKLEECRKALEKHQQVAAKVEVARECVEVTRRKAKILQGACTVLDAKTGLPIFLVDTCLGFLEARINDHMLALGHPDLHVRLITQQNDKETLDIVVQEEGQPSLDLAAYSGGQLTRMELAIKLALADTVRQRCACRLSMFLVDEPTEGGLDEDGKVALISLLHEHARTTFKTVMVISHDEKLISAFSDVRSLGLNDDRATVLLPP